MKRGQACGSEYPQLVLDCVLECAPGALVSSVCIVAIFVVVCLPVVYLA